MATAAPSTVFTSGSRPLLEYWHLLSFDAPTVAVLWACLLCNATRVAVPVPSVVFLGLGTWLLYAADRILDVVQPLDPAHLRQRHYFHQTHRKAFVIAGFAVLVGVSVLALHYLPEKALSIFSRVFLATVGYFFVVHWGPSAIRRWFPKELAVGTVFASAVAVPAWSQLSLEYPRGHLMGAVLLLAALFWLNCVAIESWESVSLLNLRASDRAVSGRLRIWRDPPSSIGARLLALGVASAAACCLGNAPRAEDSSILPPIYLCSLASATALFYLDIVQTSLSPLRLRIAADVALLTPLAFLLLPSILTLPRLLLFSGSR